MLFRISTVVRIAKFDTFLNGRRATETSDLYQALFSIIYGALKHARSCSEFVETVQLPVRSVVLLSINFSKGVNCVRAPVPRSMYT